MPTAIESEWLYLIDRARRTGDERTLHALERAYVRWLDRYTAEG